MNILVTGQSGSGKTTWCTRYIARVRKAKCCVGGILSLEVYQEDRRIGFNGVDLLTGEEVIFARLSVEASLEGIRVGAYTISHEGILFGLDAIQRAVKEVCDFVVIDEVGPLELSGGGLMSAASLALISPLNTLIVIRSCLKDVFLRYIEQKGTRESLAQVKLS